MCACNFISFKITNWSCNFRWAWSSMLRQTQSGFWNLYISKIIGVPKLIFGLLPLGEKENLWNHHCQYVSMSVCQWVNNFSPKWLIRFTWNFTWSWSDLKVKNWQTQIFRKKLHLGDNNQKCPKKRSFFYFLKSLIYRFFWFKGCTILVLWFCNNRMPGKNMVLKLYTKSSRRIRLQDC